MADPSNPCTVIVLGCVLEQVFGVKCEPVHADSINYFYAEKLPSMSINEYFRRLAMYTECSDQVLMLALIYVDRIHMDAFEAERVQHSPLIPHCTAVCRKVLRRLHDEGH